MSLDPEQKEKRAGYIRILWLLVILALLLTVVVFIFISKTQIPDTKTLENPDIELATQILADDGSELGKAFKLNREWVRHEELNPYLVDALISTEDERFFDHSGIDIKGTLRAVVFLGKRGGASTITQQLAKQFFTKGSKSTLRRVWQKLKEWVIATEFEKRYTKEEILAMYLNKFDFIYGANGVSAAAQTYFGKDQKDISVDEAAILIGMLKNPYYYNPKKFPEKALIRRNIVLAQMVRNNKLTEAAYDKLKVRPINMADFKRDMHFTGIAPYFRAELQKEVKKILDDSRNTKADGTKYDIYTDGLKIYTTIDMKMQKYAEEALVEHMKNLQAKYFRVWEGKDPWTAGADADQRRIRQSSLQRQMRESERFSLLRRKYMSGITAKISDDIKDVRLWDGDIFRLFAEEENPGKLKELSSNGIISRQQAATYKQILDSPYWPELKSQWRKLRLAADKAFSQKVRMEVFDYSANGVKEVTMSPMDSIRYHNMHMQLGSLGVNPQTGEIKTWVGGINYKYFQYDHIKANRQVGSTFKPFVYATAISDLAISPCQKFQDIQYTIPAGDKNFGLIKTWAPANASNTFTKQWLSLKEGLKQSKNSISVKLMKEIGNAERVARFAANLGIPKEKIPSFPSIALGTPELSLMDMAGAYTAFANNGTYSKPYFIKKIVDQSGKTIYTGDTEKKKVINPSYNYVMVDMLKYAASFIAPRFKSELGGKTGTTNDYKDGWFVGITPELVVATWVGGDNEWIRFTSLADGQGAVMARPFFEKMLKKIESDPSVNYNVNARFPVPENLFVELDCTKYDVLKAQDQKEKTEAPKEEEFEEEF